MYVLPKANITKTAQILKVQSCSVDRPLLCLLKPKHYKIEVEFQSSSKAFTKMKQDRVKDHVLLQKKGRKTLSWHEIEAISLQL